MELAVAKRLIHKGVETGTTPQHWADLGAGKGLFTKALADLLLPESVVHAVDRDRGALGEIGSHPSVRIETIDKDFLREHLNLPPLDGILIANALHFVKEKIPFLSMLKTSLTTRGRMIVVEYDRETATPWVPFPVPFSGLEDLVIKAGFRTVTKLDEEPSVFNRVNIYAAVVS